MTVFLPVLKSLLHPSVQCQQPSVVTMTGTTSLLGILVLWSVSQVSFYASGVNSNGLVDLLGGKCGLSSNETSKRFPWDVRLGYRRNGRLGWFCSGVFTVFVEHICSFA